MKIITCSVNINCLNCKLMQHCEDFEEVNAHRNPVHKITDENYYEDRNPFPEEAFEAYESNPNIHDMGKYLLKSNCGYTFRDIIKATNNQIKAAYYTLRENEQRDHEEEAIEAIAEELFIRDAESGADRELNYDGDNTLQEAIEIYENSLQELILTCSKCSVRECEYRDDPYNTDGDCLALK